MTITEQIYRITRIANLLLHRSYISSEELINAISTGLSHNAQPLTKRTLQRDFHIIEELFGIQIKHHRQLGYYIAEHYSHTSEYEALLQNFELLSRIDNDSILQKYVIPEHRLPPLGERFHDLLRAIRECKIINFTYTHYRRNCTKHKHSIAPYFLKESQHRWYLIGLNEADELRTFAVERIQDIYISQRNYTRTDKIDIQHLFDECFGCWINASQPLERVVLKFSTLDGAFLESLPLHHTQNTIAKDDESITISLQLRITNDFEMALLERSKSIEVVEPVWLREKFREIFAAAQHRHTDHE